MYKLYLRDKKIVTYLEIIYVNPKLLLILMRADGLSTTYILFVGDMTRNETES